MVLKAACRYHRDRQNLGSAATDARIILVVLCSQQIIHHDVTGYNVSVVHVIAH